MRHVALAVVVVLVGCSGRYKEPQAPRRSSAEQYAANANSSVQPSPARPSWQDITVDVTETESESIAVTSSPLSGQTTVRHARQAIDLVTGGDDAPPPPSPAELAARQGQSAVGQAATAAPAPLPEQLVVEGWLGIEVDDVQKTAAAIREQVTASGGRIVSENLGGSGDGWTGEIELRLPPQAAHSFFGWLDKLGDIRSRRIQGTDVSRTLFDQQIALDNNLLTLRRLQALLERQDLNMADVLAIETQLSRIRGEIEKIKGEQRFLQDRVAMATVHLSLSRPAGVVLGEPTTKLFPGPRLSTLVLLTPDGRERVRYGGGVTVGLGHPRLTADLDVFEDADGDGASAIATFGGGLYSDHFGHGRRRFLNPYIGVRAGYGYLGRSSFAVGGEVGVELFKHKLALIDAGVRVLTLIGDDTDVAAVGALSAVFAF